MVRATHVLHVDEELNRVHGPVERAKERRWAAPHGRNEVFPRRAISHGSPDLVRVTGQRRPDQSGSTIGSPLTHDEVCGEIGGNPALAQRWGLGAMGQQQIAKGLAFLLSETEWRHGGILKRANVW
jgi:hypothetical protein